jgi:hypothetical protein
MPSFAIHISEGFDQVLAEIDRTVIEQQSSRSAVVRDILYDHFGIIPENRIGERCRIDMAIRRMQKLEQK